MNQANLDQLHVTLNAAVTSFQHATDALAAVAVSVHEANTALVEAGIETPEEGAITLTELTATSDAAPFEQYALDDARFDSVHTLQQLCNAWVIAAFDEGELLTPDRRIRRALEEMLELCQAAQVPAEVAHGLVDHIYSRPVGAVEYELGGALFTLLTYATAVELSPARCVADVLLYGYRKLEDIRTRNDQKPKDGALRLIHSQNAKSAAVQCVIALGMTYDEESNSWTMPESFEPDRTGREDQEEAAAAQSRLSLDWGSKACEEVANRYYVTSIGGMNHSRSERSWIKAEKKLLKAGVEEFLKSQLTLDSNVFIIGVEKDYRNIVGCTRIQIQVTAMENTKFTQHFVAFCRAVVEESPEEGVTVEKTVHPASYIESDIPDVRFQKLVYMMGVCHDALTIRTLGPIPTEYGPQVVRFAAQDKETTMLAAISYFLKSYQLTYPGNLYVVAFKAEANFEDHTRIELQLLADDPQKPAIHLEVMCLPSSVHFDQIGEDEDEMLVASEPDDVEEEENQPEYIKNWQAAIDMLSDMVMEAGTCEDFNADVKARAHAFLKANDTNRRGSVLPSNVLIRDLFDVLASLTVFDDDKKVVREALDDIEAYFGTTSEPYAEPVETFKMNEGLNTIRVLDPEAIALHPENQRRAAEALAPGFIDPLDDQTRIDAAAIVDEDTDNDGGWDEGDASLSPAEHAAAQSSAKTQQDINAQVIGLDLETMIDEDVLGISTDVVDTTQSTIWADGDEDMDRVPYAPMNESEIDTFLHRRQHTVAAFTSCSYSDPKRGPTKTHPDRLKERLSDQRLASIYLFETGPVPKRFQRGVDLLSHMFVANHLGCSAPDVLGYLDAFCFEFGMKPVYQYVVESYGYNVSDCQFELGFRLLLEGQKGYIDLRLAMNNQTANHLSPQDHLALCKMLQSNDGNDERVELTTRYLSDGFIHKRFFNRMCIESLAGYLPGSPEFKTLIYGNLTKEQEDVIFSWGERSKGHNLGSFFMFLRQYTSFVKPLWSFRLKRAEFTHDDRRGKDSVIAPSHIFFIDFELVVDYGQVVTVTVEANNRRCQKRSAIEQLARDTFDANKQNMVSLMTYSGANGPVKFVSQEAAARILSRSFMYANVTVLVTQLDGETADGTRECDTLMDRIRARFPHQANVSGQMVYKTFIQYMVAQGYPIRAVATRDVNIQVVDDYLSGYFQMEFEVQGVQAKMKIVLHMYSGDTLHSTVQKRGKLYEDRLNWLTNEDSTYIIADGGVHWSVADRSLIDIELRDNYNRSLAVEFLTLTKFVHGVPYPVDPDMLDFIFDEDTRLMTATQLYNRFMSAASQSGVKAGLVYLGTGTFQPNSFIMSFHVTTGKPEEESSMYVFKKP